MSNDKIAVLTGLYFLKFKELPRTLYMQNDEKYKQMLEYCVKNNKKIDDLSIEELKGFGMEGTY